MIRRNFLSSLLLPLLPSWLCFPGRREAVGAAPWPRSVLFEDGCRVVRFGASDMPSKIYGRTYTMAIYDELAERDGAK